MSECTLLARVGMTCSQRLGHPGMCTGTPVAAGSGAEAFAMATGNDAMSIMVDIYLLGAGAGVMTFLMNRQIAPVWVANQAANQVVAGLKADPLNIEEIRGVVTHYLTEHAPTRPS